MSDVTEKTIISTIKLQSGRSVNAPGTTIHANRVIVFIGPNNSGKSKLLSEIQKFCLSPSAVQRSSILESIEFEGLAEGFAESALQKVIQDPTPNDNAPLGHKILRVTPGRRIAVSPNDIKSALMNPASNLGSFSLWLTSYLLLLNGANRMQLVNKQGAGDLQGEAHSSLQLLFKDRKKRQKVRDIVFSAFGRHFVIDPTELGQLRIRLSDTAPSSEIEEIGIHPEAISFHGRAELIDTASDGVKAFTGIVLEFLAGDPRVVLIDEPEAFLHPSLAFKLGNELARLSETNAKNLIVATHSSSFLMGCLHSGAPMDIVRLTYIKGAATSRVLSGEELVTMMRNPLLRSSGVLTALFYEFVIVTEADSDRAFYQEINERLIAFKAEWGLPNCLFLNAQNKQTLKTMIRPLRDMGIPTACIVDIDIFKDPGTDFSALMQAAGLPEISRESFALLRSKICKALLSTGKDMKRHGGIDLLEQSDRQAASDLITHLKDYGLFIIDKGELESWLSHLGAKGHGSYWLTDIFSKMGEDPNSNNYSRPTTEDVWKFISEVKEWMMSSSRKGIPG